VLSKKHLDKYCLPYGAHLRCHYLAEDDNNSTKFYCLKKSNKKTIVDKELKEVLELLKKKGNDPKKQGIPLGNNCPGYFLLKNVQQGYDVPGSS
jgi:hypothetical protein